MKDFGYLTKNNELTEKGLLISNLNGYEQIPIIEMVSSRAFEGLSPVVFASTVAALANIEPKKEAKLFNKKAINHDTKPFVWDNRDVKEFVSKLEKTMNEYNDLSMKYNKNYVPNEVNYILTNYIYQWAELNSKREDSIQNWSHIYYSADKRKYRDEGTLFKGIMMTIDLLKQIKITAECGAANTKNNNDYEYYKELVEKCDLAIDLINRQPAV